MTAGEPQMTSENRYNSSRLIPTNRGNASDDELEMCIRPSGRGVLTLSKTIQARVNTPTMTRSVDASLARDIF